MANCLYLHDSCITNFDFINYVFANLLVVWVYLKLAKIIFVNMTVLNQHDSFNSTCQF